MLKNLKKPNKFVVKDSGKRQKFAGGMVRDVTDGKINYSLVADGPMFKRWAEHLTKGAAKYEAHNWMKAKGEVEYNRFRESAFRHFVQWYFRDTDEDHGSAVIFNINGAEYLKQAIPPKSLSHAGVSCTKSGGSSGKSKK